MTTLVAQDCALTQSVAEGTCIKRRGPSRATRQAAERAYDLARAFNAREGFGPDDDDLPPRMYEHFAEGPAANQAPTREQFAAAKQAFYAYMGWDPKTAAPTRERLEELDVPWVAEMMEAQS